MDNYRHGGPYDRGSADKWYGRPFNPHYYKGDTYSSDLVEEVNMTPEEIAEYELGYDENEQGKEYD